MIKRLDFQFSDVVGGWVRPARLQFVTNVGGEWQIYDIGNLISETKYVVEFDNIIAKSAWGWDNFRNMFLFNGSYSESSNSYPRGATISVTFKNPLSVLKGFYYYFSTSVPSYLKIYDENDTLIYENDNLELELGETTNTSITLASNYFKEIPELQIIKAYPVGVLGTLETNNISHISNIYSVDQILPYQVEPDGTMIRYALSFDNRATYQSYKNGSWNTINKANIINEGMTQTELSGLTTSEYVLALTDKKTIDIFIGMMTTNTTTTPSVSKITTDYLEIV